jgi:hypothetical protein
MIQVFVKIPLIDTLNFEKKFLLPFQFLSYVFNVAMALATLLNLFLFI